MKLDQGMMDEYASGATKRGMENWSDRNDMNGLQAVLDYIAPQPVPTERTSRELMQMRTILTNAVNARMRIINCAGTMWPDPQAACMVRTLDTVIEILAPYAGEEK